MSSDAELIEQRRTETRARIAKVAARLVEIRIAGGEWNDEKHDRDGLAMRGRIRRIVFSHAHPHTLIRKYKHIVHHGAPGSILDTLRIADLVAIDALGTTLIAGASGMARRVGWAHSCELEFADRWMGQDELLMTVGLGIPADPAGQAALIRRLDAAGLAGIAIGDMNTCPPISKAMRDEADTLGFPMLLTALDVPFVALGRTVAAANSNRQAQQVVTLNRLYHVLIETRESWDSFLTTLGDIFNVRMLAVDIATGVTVLPGNLEIGAAEIAAFVSNRSPLATTRMSTIEVGAGRTISAWSVPAQRPTLLFIDESNPLMLDSFTVVHLGRAVSIESDRRAAAVLARDSKIGQIVAAASGGDRSYSRLEADASELGLTIANLVALVGLASSSAEDPSVALSLAGVVHGCTRANGYWTLVLGAGDLDRCREILMRLGLRTGASRRFVGFAGLTESALKAQWALESIRGADEMTVDYDDAIFSVMPRTRGEANEIVQRVLGGLIDTDGAPSMFLDTLCTFLDEDRNWTATAERLGIHRQTLAYRLKQIELITGRKLKRTRDLSELWIARTALRMR